MSEGGSGNADNSRSGEEGASSSGQATSGSVQEISEAAVFQQLAVEALSAPPQNLNFALDLILTILRKTIRDMGYSTIIFTEVQTIFGPWRSGRFFIDRGWFKSPASVVRTGDVTVDTTAQSSYLINGCFGLRLLELEFDKYELTFFGYGSRGRAKFQVGSNSVNIQIQAEIREDVYRFKVVNVRLVKMSNITTEITGLWPFTYIMSKSIPVLLFIFWWPIARSIEISAKNAINEALISAGLQEDERQQSVQEDVVEQ